MPFAQRPEWTLVIHGGSGIIERGKLSPDQEQGARTGLDVALEAGAKILADAGSALDAVQAAVEVLEDDPHFNAGRGAVFTWDALNELDAAVMDGRTRDAGAVAGLTTTRHPVAAARKVMEASPHVLLTGIGADGFAADQGLEQVDNGWFALPERRAQLERMKAQPDWFDVDLKYGTVGAVALDRGGNVAAATSTGGLTGKRWGRIGDSPLIGAGTYADNRSCAVSATGAGEYFIREGVAHEIGARMRLAGEDMQTAADAVLAETRALGGTGGVILAAPDGSAGWSFTTPGMYRGLAASDGRRIVAMYGDE